MKKIFFHLHIGYCGEDAYEVIEYAEDVTDEQISEDGYYSALEHAATYGYELCYEDCNDPDCDMEHEGNHNIEGSWELYDPKKHNKFSFNGKGDTW